MLTSQHGQRLDDDDEIPVPTDHDMSDDITMLAPPLEDMLEHLLPSSHPAQSHVEIKSWTDSLLQPVCVDGLTSSAVSSTTPPQEMPDMLHNVPPASDVVIESWPHSVPQFLPGQDVSMASPVVTSSLAQVLLDIAHDVPSA